jgi:hypothetical protein
MEPRIYFYRDCKSAAYPKRKTCKKIGQEKSRTVFKNPVSLRTSTYQPKKCLPSKKHLPPKELQTSRVPVIKNSEPANNLYSAWEMPAIKKATST